ncbi:MAG: PqiC family protein [Burkholderiales bacterium]
MNLVRARFALASAILLGVLALGACGTSPPTAYYDLNAAVPAGTAATSAPNTARRIIIVSTTVPGTVDRPQLVLSESTGRVAFAEFHRWSDPPRTAIPGTVAAQLTRALGGAEVWPSSVAAPADADVRVLLNVTRFDGALGEAADVEVLWTVRSGAVERTGRTAAREPANGADHAALVAAYARALGAVSRDLATAIRALPPPAR